MRYDLTVLNNRINHNNGIALPCGGRGGAKCTHHVCYSHQPSAWHKAAFPPPPLPLSLPPSLPPTPLRPPPSLSLHPPNINRPISRSTNQPIRHLRKGRWHPVRPQTTFHPQAKYPTFCLFGVFFNAPHALSPPLLPATHAHAHRRTHPVR